jgi:hypothetical protein
MKAEFRDRLIELSKLTLVQPTLKQVLTKIKLSRPVNYRSSCASTVSRVFFLRVWSCRSMTSAGYNGLVAKFASIDLSAGDFLESVSPFVDLDSLVNTSWPWCYLTFTPVSCTMDLLQPLVGKPLSVCFTQDGASDSVWVKLHNCRPPNRLR